MSTLSDIIKYINWILICLIITSFYYSMKYVLVKNNRWLENPDLNRQSLKSKIYHPPIRWVTFSQEKTSNYKNKFEQNNCSHSFIHSLPIYAHNRCNGKNSCRNLSCNDFIRSENTEIFNEARLLIKVDTNHTDTRIYLQDSYFVNLTSDCEYYKYKRGYILNPLTEESANFPIAFNIIAHKDTEQLEMLLRALYRPQNSFCIHLDSKSKPAFVNAVTSISKCFDNIKLASKTTRIHWGGFSRLQADINCMQDQLNTTKEWKYLINTASQAFPIRTIEEMVKILKIYNGSNDIEGIYGNRVLKSRFQDEWIENNDGIVKTGKKNPSPPHDIDIVRGSAYGIFSRKFVEFILNDKLAIDLLKWSEKTWSPDEHYWATLNHLYSNPHLHTPGGFSGYPSDKEWLAVYADWGSKCKGKYVRSVCVFGIEDLHVLVNRKEFFVNKFYIDYQPLAFDCIAAWIKHKEVCPLKFDDTYYKNLAFVKENKNNYRIITKYPFTTIGQI